MAKGKTASLPGTDHRGPDQPFSSQDEAHTRMAVTRSLAKLPLPPHQSTGPCTVLLLCMATCLISLSFSWEQRMELLLESTLGTSLVVNNLPCNAEDTWSRKIPFATRQLSL